MVKFLRRIRDDDSGQDLVEYVILMALLAVIVIIALKAFGPAVSNAFNDVAGGMPK